MQNQRLVEQDATLHANHASKKLQLAESAVLEKLFLLLLQLVLGSRGDLFLPTTVVSHLQFIQ